MTEAPNLQDYYDEFDRLDKQARTSDATTRRDAARRTGTDLSATGPVAKKELVVEPVFGVSPARRILEIVTQNAKENQAAREARLAQERADQDKNILDLISDK